MWFVTGCISQSATARSADGKSNWSWTALANALLIICWRFLMSTEEKTEQEILSEILHALTSAPLFEARNLWEKRYRPTGQSKISKVEVDGRRQMLRWERHEPLYVEDPDGFLGIGKRNDGRYGLVFGGSAFAPEALDGLGDP